MFAGDLTMGLSLAGGVMTPGSWGHVAFAIDATGTAKLFVDGAEVASGLFQGAVPFALLIQQYFSHVSVQLSVAAAHIQQ